MKRVRTDFEFFTCVVLVEGLDLVFLLYCARGSVLSLLPFRSEYSQDSMLAFFESFHELQFVSTFVQCRQIWTIASSQLDSL